MRYIAPPEPAQQNLLLDDFESTHWIYQSLNESARRLLQEGWQHPFRQTVLGLLPADKVGEGFSPDFGRPTKEIHSMIGLVLIAEFKQWTAAEAAEAYTFNTDIHYALNLAPNKQYVSERTFEEYRRRLRDGEELISDLYAVVTAEFVQQLGLDISRQRLDSSHVFSNMAKFGRCQLLGVTTKRFLTQVLRHSPEEHQALPAELLARYAPREGRLFGMGGRASDEEYAQRIQQLAEDMHYLVGHFADMEHINKRSSYQALSRAFEDHFTVAPAKGRSCAKVEIKEKATDKHNKSGGVMQNPSDPDAGYSGHKGVGYQVQLAQTYGNEDTAEDGGKPGVELIVGCLPQNAAASDSDSLQPMLEQQMENDLLGAEVLADTAYGSDANQQIAKEAGVNLVSPVPGKAAAAKGQGKKAIPKKGETEPPEDPTKADRLEERRAEQQTPKWQDKYKRRNGIEGLNSGLKRVFGMGRLVYRGRRAVRMSIFAKVIGWNLRQVGRSYARKGIIGRKQACAAGV